MPGGAAGDEGRASAAKRSWPRFARPPRRHETRRVKAAAVPALVQNSGGSRTRGRSPIVRLPPARGGAVRLRRGPVARRGRLLIASQSTDPLMPAATDIHNAIGAGRAVAEPDRAPNSRRT